MVARCDLVIVVFFDCTVGIVQMAWEDAKGEKGGANQIRKLAINLEKYLQPDLIFEEENGQISCWRTNLCQCGKERVHGVTRVHLPHTSG